MFSTLSMIANGDWLGLLNKCDGYYRCRKDGDKRLSPLVGYAGKYDGPNGTKLQWVGDEYANFAKIESNGVALKGVAEALLKLLKEEKLFDSLTGFCGMPMGGLKLAGALSVLSGFDDIYPEKKVIELAATTSTGRDKSILEFVRHDVREGGIYVLVEDVCNNFSTTKDGIDLIEGAGGIVTRIVCFLNRSPSVRGFYSYGARKIPIVALVDRPIPEYRQDDPFVAADVAAGNIVWKPKDEWHKLRQSA